MLLFNKRIFIVEDDMENRIIARIALATEGAFVDFDRGGRSVMERLKTFGAVDLIVLDLMLGNMINGYDVFKIIRRNSAYASVPIIAVSAADPNTAMVRCQQAGFDGFIAKPIDTDVFAQQLADVIAGESIWFAGQ